MKKMKKVLASSLVLSFILTPLSTFALTKEETVYSKLNSDGSIKKVLVNEHLINSDNTDQLTDLTDLENIININSDSKFTLDNNKITWDSNKEDIFFQGTTKKDLPVSTKITYKLNGKEIALDDLIGKSGTVELTIKYTNNSKRSVNVNGKLETLYTPFVIATVTNFSNSNTSNIKVTNGKVVDNGIGYTVTCLSTPGLYESLNIDELKGLDTIKITLDTTKFELSSIYSVVTPKLLDSTDLKVFDKLDSAYSNINKLQSSMNQIEEGSKTILENLDLISDGSDKIATSLGLVLANLEKIKNGSVKLDKGLTEVVESLNASSDMLNGMDEKIASMQSLIDGNNQYIAGLNTTKQQYETLASKYANGTITEEEAKQLPYLKVVYDKFNLGNQEKSLITVLTLNNKALSESIEAFKKIGNAFTSLNTYLPLFKQGADDLSNGTEQLTNGVSLLNEKMGELSTGTKALRNGMNTLNTGINTFNNQGIKAITDVASKVENVAGKIEALSKLSNEYQSFSLKDEKTESNTKFILVVDGKKAKEEKKTTSKTTKKESFWDRLVNLFK